MHKRFIQGGGEIYNKNNLLTYETNIQLKDKKQNVSSHSDNWKKKFLEIQKENQLLQKENNILKKKLKKLEKFDLKKY